MAVYLTATEFRNITNLQTEEYADTQLNQMINAATVEIDLKTGRTWQAVTTVTNEYYDGDGTTKLKLNKTDIASVTALSIDSNYDGTFVSVDPTQLIVYADGTILIDVARYSPTVSSFTKGNKTVKITYTYGTSAPTDFVKNLCAMIVLQQLRPEQNLAETIDKRISLIRANSTSSI
jgi:hypothetical protein